MSEFNRRTFLAGGVALGTGAIIGSSALAQQKFAGTTLNINGYGGAWDQVLVNNAVKPLQAEGLNVVFQPGGSSAAVARAIASRDNPPFDLMMCDSPSMPELIKANILRDVTEAEVPNIRDLIPGTREFGNVGVPIAISSLVLIYNEKTIKNPPKSIKELSSPEFKGRVGIFNLENTAGVLMLLALAEANGGSVDNVDPAFEILRQIKPNLVNATGATATLIQMFEQGEADVGVMWNGRVSIMRNKHPVRHVIPAEGMYSLFSYLSLVERSPRRDAALAFLNSAASPQTSEGFARETFYSGTNVKAKLSEAEASAVLNFGENARKSLKTSDWTKIAAARPGWMERWNREMAR
jgi:putative spermidine/putrescine transport system substrate-binding protein